VDGVCVRLDVCAGYGDGGVLTDAVRRRPFAVVVFSNAHLAHPEALNLVQQVGLPSP
jgi:ATP-dependent Clp protease ATP-binding subunit ClpA